MMNTLLKEEHVHLKLAEAAVQCLKTSNDTRILVAMVGIPGAGKTTVANAVSRVINEELAAREDFKLKCKVVGMDGFHHYRYELQKMEDPVTMFKRRGAPFTFDANSLIEFITELKESCDVLPNERQVIKCPSFDHKAKDPMPHGTVIDKDVNIVIIEGLYLLLNIEPWVKISSMVHQKWFIQLDPMVARERTAKRHVAAGIEQTLEDAYIRVDANDVINGAFITDHLVPVDIQIGL